MKRALVSGSAGFVGRHAAQVLTDRGYSVNCWDIAEGNDALYLFQWDTDVYDLVVHCAAVEPHRAAIDGRPMNLAANLHLDSAMFEWAVRTKQRRVLYFSSPAAYPVHLQTGDPQVLLRESDIESEFTWSSPDAAYGWTKLTGERMARAANEVGLPTYVVRPFSGYGEDQSLNFPFPSIVKRARDGDLMVWGPPGQTRDWIHIDDVIAGALEVVEQDVREPVNLCTGIGTEMGELALMVARLAGEPEKPVTYLPDKPTGVMYRVGDPTRMEQIYKPRVSIEEGIARALARS
ncbi:MAG TPA: NAD-dependent epimerase/dehydratase family protein [Jiangellaceae bacterium]|nr:NAD-dependent epimerase/dehydratase family protein [Jiangellaceae bacterium]